VITQTLQNDNIYALHNRITILEVILRYYIEKSAKYEEYYSKMDTWQQDRGKAVIGWGAGRVVSLLVAP
jgi:RecA-family ATPase